MQRQTRRRKKTLQATKKNFIRKLEENDDEICCAKLTI
jgi:hypothetical protein